MSLGRVSDVMTDIVKTAQGVIDFLERQASIKRQKWRMRLPLYAPAICGAEPSAGLPGIIPQRLIAHPVKVDRALLSCQSVVGEESGPRTFPPTELDLRHQPKLVEGSAIVKTKEIASLIAVDAHTKLNRRLRKNWPSRMILEMKEVQSPFALQLHDLKAAGRLLEHGQAGVDAGLHLRQVKAGSKFERVVLHALCESIARKDEAIGMHGNQA